MTLHSIIPLVSSIACFAMGIAVFGFDPKNKKNRLFMFFCLGLAYWALMEFGGRRSHSFAEASDWRRAFSLWPIVVGLLLHFFLRFTERLQRPRDCWYLVAVYLPAGVATIIELSTHLITGMPVKTASGWVYHFTERTPVSLAVHSWFYLACLLSLYWLIRYYRSSQDERQRNQTRIFIIGSLIGIVCAVVESVLRMLNFDPPTLVSVSLIVVVGFIGFAMWKHQLFRVSPGSAAQTIVSTIADALLLVDLEGRIRLANKAAQQLLGYASEELLGQLMKSFFAAESSRPSWLKIPVGPEIIPPDQDIETILLTRGGERVPVFLTSAELRQKNEKFGFLLIARDISDKKRAENLLRVQRDLGVALGTARGLPDALAYVLEAAVQIDGVDCGGVYLVDDQSGALELVVHRNLSDSFVDKMGYFDKDTAQGKVALKGRTFYLSTAELAQHTSAIPYQSEGIKSLAVIPVIFEGNTVALVNIASHQHEAIAQPARRALEVIAGLVGGTLQRLRAQAALEESEEKYRRVIQNAQEGIIVLQEGLIKLANPKAVQICGWPIDELYRQRFIHWVHHEDRETVDRRYSTRLRGEKLGENFIFRIVDGRGNVKWVEVSAVKITWENRPATLNFLNDITEMRESAEQKLALETQLQQSQKMEAIGSLAGGVAHDINNILAAIMGAASALEDETEREDHRFDDIESILAACRKGTRLTRDLLGFARRGKYNRERVALNDIVNTVINLLKHTISKKIAIKSSPAPDLRFVEGDASQIEHALMNICINSSDAMQNGGELSISTRNTELDGSAKGSLMLPPGPYVELCVTDTGAGMDRDTLSRVFEPFFTTKPKGKGTGLGLSMVYGTVENHGGTVHVDSKPTVGTSVTMMLPATEYKPPTGIGKRSSIPPIVAPAGNVLLIDDERMILKATKRLLVKLGFTVFLAESGRSAIDLYRKKGDQISLVILDLMMPGMDGSEIFNALYELDPQVKVLLCSGYSKNEEVKRLLAKGARGFLPKPFDYDLLSREIAKITNATAGHPQAHA